MLTISSPMRGRMRRSARDGKRGFVHVSSRCRGLAARAGAGLIIAVLALPMPIAARTAAPRPHVATHSAVYVERVQSDTMRRLEPAERLSRGDRVITVVNWSVQGNRGDSFVITNPLPSALAYEASAWDDQDVSVDGGRTWGRLGVLKVGTREATPQDVTHIRWRIVASDHTRGQIAYSGIVR